jgi:hypothetical protein
VNDHGKYQALVNAAEQFLVMVQRQGAPLLLREDVAYLYDILNAALDEAKE